MVKTEAGMCIYYYILYMNIICILFFQKFRQKWGAQLAQNIFGSYMKAYMLLLSHCIQHIGGHPMLGGYIPSSILGVFIQTWDKYQKIVYFQILL